MTRPCTCDRFTPMRAYTLDQCRLCWLYHHDPAYRALWGGPARAPCRHLGEAIDLATCDSCQGSVQLKVFACNVYGRCTTQRSVSGLECCVGCIDYSN